MARLVVAIDGLAQEGERYLVADGGVAKPIIRALVVENGICRQYWPSTSDGSDARIKWNEVQYDVKESKADPSDTQATITFDRATGMVTYNDYANVDAVAEYLIPPLDGTIADDGKYAIKVVQNSGTAIAGNSLSTWIDLNESPTLTWYLERTTIGANNASTTISVAADTVGTTESTVIDRAVDTVIDRNGDTVITSSAHIPIPDAATQVDKTVTFWAQVRAATGDINWTTTQEDLVEITEAIDATCDLTFNPTGNAVGSADTSGSFTDEWHEDYPSVADPSLYTVQVDLVSGTTPSGPTLAIPHTLDVTRNWQLLATSSENFSCSLDVTVSDGVTPVTKRITMNSQRSAAASTNVWTTTSWALFGVGFDPDDAIANVIFNLNGESTGQATGLADIDEDWHSEAAAASDPENYEVWVEVISQTGTLVLTGDTLNTWHVLSTNRIFIATVANTLGPIEVGDAELLVKLRRIGQASVDKTVLIQLNTETPI